MLVTIVYVPTADRTGPDVDRMETVEDIEPDLARAMLADGSAREPSGGELAAYGQSRKVGVKPTEAAVLATSDQPTESAGGDAEVPAESDAARTGRSRSRA